MRRKAGGYLSRVAQPLVRNQPVLAARAGMQTRRNITPADIPVVQEQNTVASAMPEAQRLKRSVVPRPGVADSQRASGSAEIVSKSAQGLVPTRGVRRNADGIAPNRRSAPEAALDPSAKPAAVAAASKPASQVKPSQGRASAAQSLAADVKERIERSRATDMEEPVTAQSLPTVANQRENPHPPAESVDGQSRPVEPSDADIPPTQRHVASKKNWPGEDAGEQQFVPRQQLQSPDRGQQDSISLGATRVHIGTLEIRTVAAQPPVMQAAVAPQRTSERIAAHPHLQTIGERLSRPLAWSFGLIQG